MSTNKSEQRYSVILTSWHDYAEALQRVRRAVFIEEQNVPEELEWDEADMIAQHALVFDAKNKPVGTGRLLETGQIGRMAVLKPYRGKGVGEAILKALVDAARQYEVERCFLQAQTTVIPFYERYGFVAEGEEFLDANIPHRTMYLVL